MPVVRALHRIDPALTLAPLNQDDPHAFAWLMLTTTTLTTAIWLAVTLLTRPESEATLQAFYDRVRPAALGWRSLRPPQEQRDSTLALQLLPLGTGLYPHLRDALRRWVICSSAASPTAAALMALSAACLGLLFWSLDRRGWSVWK